MIKIWAQSHEIAAVENKAASKETKTARMLFALFGARRIVFADIKNTPCTLKAYAGGCFFM